MLNQHPRRTLHYAWIAAGVTFLVLLASAGVRSAPGLLIVPLEQEFGWSRATISAAISVNLVLYGLVGPFMAGLGAPGEVARRGTAATRRKRPPEHQAGSLC